MSAESIYDFSVVCDQQNNENIGENQLSVDISVPLTREQARQLSEQIDRWGLNWNTMILPFTTFLEMIVDDDGPHTKRSRRRSRGRWRTHLRRQGFTGPLITLNHDEAAA